MASVLIDRDMYNGLYHLTHNPVARGSQPRYVLRNQDNTILKPKGTTTILGAVLAKDLMGWAVSCCVEYLRAKLPVVTAEDLEAGAKAYTVKRDGGANTGTEAHAMVESFLKSLPVDVGIASPEARNAYEAFVKWFSASKPEVLNVEEVIYSAAHQYAGTYDCMLRVNDKVYLCDLKTTNPSRKAPQGVYAEYFIQLGAYAAAHEEQREWEAANGGTKLEKIEGLMVISAKKNGKLDIVTSEDVGLTVEECGNLFVQVVNIFNFLKVITTKLGGK